jgi:hypothetical protein
LATDGITGAVHGGQQPVAGATVQFYTVGTSGDGSASSFLTVSTTTNANGEFNIPAFSCSSPTEPVYFLATGGNPGVASANSGIELMTAWGACNTFIAGNGGSFVSINELTTVAGVYALAPYISSPTAIGSGAGDATALANAFALASELVNPATGQTPGAGVPNGDTVPVAQLNTLADIIASCVNTTGGVANDSSACGLLYGQTTVGNKVPSNTLMALLNLANNPTLNTAALYALAQAKSPYQPVQPLVPPDLSVKLGLPTTLALSPSGGLTFASTANSSQSASQFVTLTNNGSSTITISGITLTGANPADFTEQSTCGSTLAVSASCYVVVVFAPTTGDGVRTAYVYVTSTDPNSPASIPLSGTATGPFTPAVTLTPSSLTFTDTVTPQTLTLTNTTGIAYSVGTIAIATPADPTATYFTQTNNCGTILAANGTCSITVLASQVYASKTATLTVTDGAGNSPQTASLSATADPSLAITAGGTLFGPVAIGSTSSELSWTDPNVDRGYYPGQVSVNITGPNAQDFAITPSFGTDQGFCIYTVGGSCTLYYYFKPLLAGLRTATLHTPAANIFLSGWGASTPASFAYNTPSLSLGSIAVGKTANGGATITSTGQTSIVLGNPVVSGTNASEFTASTNCGGAVMATGATCQLSVSATPLAAGTRTANITITDSTNMVSMTLPVSVNAEAVTLSSSALTFTTFGQTKNVTLTNGNGASLAIASIATSAGFSQTNTCGTTVAPGGTCTITVSSAAADPSATATGTLTVTDNAISGTQTASLADSFGTVYSFGSVSQGQSSAPLTFTGQMPTIYSTYYYAEASVSGLNAGDFQFVNGINSCYGYNCTVQLVFEPTAAGVRVATLTYTLGGLNFTTETIYGYGVATPPAATITVPTLTTTQGAQIPFTGTVKNTGGTTLSISGLNAFSSSLPDIAFTGTTCGGTLAQYATCTVSGTYLPYNYPGESGTLKVYDTTSGQTLSTAITTTVGYEVIGGSPSTLNFGALHVGTSSAPMTIVLSNPALHTLNLSIPYDSFSNYSISPSQCTTATCNVQVTFTATTPGVAGIYGYPGNDTRWIQVSDASDGQGTTFPVIGFSGIPNVVFTPSTLNFGTITVGQTAAAQSISITNTGDGPASISIGVPSGPSIAAPSDFSPNSSQIVSIAPGGAAQTLTYTFKPTASGVRNATIPVTNYAPGGIANAYGANGAAITTLSLNGSGQ